MAKYKIKEEKIPILYDGDKITEKLLKLSDRLSIIKRCHDGYVVQIKQDGETYYMETRKRDKRDYWLILEDADKYFQYEKIKGPDCVIECCDPQSPLDIIEIRLKDRVQELYISPHRVTGKGRMVVD